MRVTSCRRRRRRAGGAAARGRRAASRSTSRCWTSTCRAWTASSWRGGSRAAPALRSLRMVMLTVLGHRPRGARARRGVTEFLTKPVRQSRLYDAIASAMHHAPARSSARRGRRRPGGRTRWPRRQRRRRRADPHRRGPRRQPDPDGAAAGQARAPHGRGRRRAARRCALAAEGGSTWCSWTARCPSWTATRPRARSASARRRRRGAPADRRDDRARDGRRPRASAWPPGWTTTWPSRCGPTRSTPMLARWLPRGGAARRDGSGGDGRPARRGAAADPSTTSASTTCPRLRARGRPRGRPAFIDSTPPIIERIVLAAEGDDHVEISQAAHRPQGRLPGRRRRRAQRPRRRARAARPRGGAAEALRTPPRASSGAWTRDAPCTARPASG